MNAGFACGLFGEVGGLEGVLDRCRFYRTSRIVSVTVLFPETVRGKISCPLKHVNDRVAVITTNFTTTGFYGNY